jgi:type VI secretion system Hcp family effector
MPSDYLLQIEGIKGESKDSKHPNTIEVESFSWGNTNDGSAGHGSGAGAGKVHFQDFHFTSQVNKASAELMIACATGKHIKKAQLFVRKQGENQQDYYTVTLETSSSARISPAVPTARIICRRTSSRSTSRRSSSSTSRRRTTAASSRRSPTDGI